MEGFKYKSPYSNEEYVIVLFKRRYSYTGRLAVIAETMFGEPYGTFTVCIPHTDLSSEDEGLAFVDTNNNPGVDKWLEENGIAIATGKTAESGYCVYPEYKFNLDLLEE